MKRALCIAVITLLSGSQALAHRLDEYLQGTIVSIAKNRVDAQITLTPGVAIFPLLLGEIDTDKDGLISSAEQHAYAIRVLRDLTLRMDGLPLTPQITSLQFPTVEEMKYGRGEIHIGFSAAFPSGGHDRKLVLENRHQPRVSAYQVNCLVPDDADIHIVRQNRNYPQSVYELDFTQSGGRLLAGTQWPLGLLALFLAARLTFVSRRRVRPAARAPRAAESISSPSASQHGR